MRRIALLIAAVGLTRGATLWAAEPEQGQPLDLQLQNVVPVEVRINDPAEPQPDQGAQGPVQLVRKPGESGEKVLVIREAEEETGGAYFIGLEVEPLPAELREKLASQMKIQEGTGLVIEQVVPDSPAAKAGLKTGDVLLSAGGRLISKRGDLSAAIQAAKEGNLNLGLVRDGKTMKLAVRPARREAIASETAVPDLVPLAKKAQSDRQAGEEQEARQQLQRALEYLQRETEANRPKPGAPADQSGAVQSLLELRRKLQGRAHELGEQLEALGGKSDSDDGRQLLGQLHEIQEQIEGVNRKLVAIESRSPGGQREAPDREQLLRQAKALAQAAAQLAEVGRTKEAEQLKHEAHELAEQAEAATPRTKTLPTARLELAPNPWYPTGKLPAGASLPGQPQPNPGYWLSSVGWLPGTAQPGQSGGPEQRLAQARMAIQLLAQAGFTDEAQRVKQKVEEMTRELEKARSSAGPQNPSPQSDASSVAELRSEIQQLRRELAELRELVRKSQDK